ncbi:MAG: hypothetical protein WEA09_03530 [Gemmatimonadota bacterium]
MLDGGEGAFKLRAVNPRTASIVMILLLTLTMQRYIDLMPSMAYLLPESG